MDSPDIFRMILLERFLFGGDADVLEGDVSGIGTGDAVGAGEIEVFERDVLDGTFFKTFDHATVLGVDRSDMVNVDVAELWSSIRKRFGWSFGVTKRKDNGCADIFQMKIGSDNIFNNTAAPAHAFKTDAIIRAVAGAIKKADVPDIAGLFAADGANAVAVGNVQAEIGDVFSRTIYFPAFFIAAGFDSESVIPHVGKTIMHDDVAAGVGVQSIGVG